MRLKIVTRRSFLRLALLALLLAGLAVTAYFIMIRMPGTTFSGPLPALTEAQRELADELSGYVHHLAGEPIGERNLDVPANLDASATWLTETLAEFGYEVRHQTFDVGGQTCVNIDVELPGASRPSEIVVVGGHYDSVIGCPGANDNGSGVAATLALARRFAASPQERTIRFALFVNEEPPYFQTDAMGAVVYANGCKARGENVVAMLSLETIGYYDDTPGSQHYPPAVGMLYPSAGNFIAFVGNIKSRSLVHQAIGTFREKAHFPSEGGALPGWVTGVGWSDHWAFWQAGYMAIMLTDTAPFRYPHYHDSTDTPDKVDYERTARVVDGVAHVIEALANPG